MIQLYDLQKKMNRLIGFLLLALCFIFTSCAHVSEKGTKRVVVLDFESVKPVEGVPLVYHYVTKPYWIVGKVDESKPYVSDKNGIAFVPEQKMMHAAAGSGWTSFRRESEPDSPSAMEIYYVTKVRVDQGAGINSESLRTSP
jgi:hypothetical protein